ncbi:unnamed protein product, partial [Choristocarpus tenellus]
QNFEDLTTDLGTSTFAFVKTHILQAKRAQERANLKQQRFNAPFSEGVGGLDHDAGWNVKADGSREGGRDKHSRMIASPEAWERLNSLMYTREQTGESVPFPQGLGGLLSAVSAVLSHCVGTGDLAVRLSVVLDDLTLFMAQRSEKERQGVIETLTTPIEAVEEKLTALEEKLGGFQRTMHLVVHEVDNDKARSDAIKSLGSTVEEMQALFAGVRNELHSKASVSEIENALEEMTNKIKSSTDQQSRLQQLARTLGMDNENAQAIKKLRVELEQTRLAAMHGLLPSADNQVLIGSKCLSCNRPLNSMIFSPPPEVAKLVEWFPSSSSANTGKGERLLEPVSTGGG